MRFSLFDVAWIISISIVSATCPESCHCSLKFTKVECHGLQTVPKTLPITTEHLSLANNLLREITAESFKNLINLKILNLKSNKIYLISKNSFINQSKLVSLNLNNNDLKTIENGSFFGASSLTKLYLTSNHLTNIPSLYGLSSLKDLLLDANDISEVLFTQDFRQLKSLSSINLSNNYIKRLTVQSLKNLDQSKIRKISFSRNQITNIETNTFQSLKNINSINLSDNPFTADVLKNCLYAVGSSLNSLDISALKNVNNISDIMDVLRNLSLKTLVLSRNHFSNIPSGTFKFLNSLEILKLDYCSITNLENTVFTNLTRLKTLFLNGNSISYLTDIFPPKLIFLYLNGNKIQRVPKEVFGRLSDLRELHLQYNRIVQFDTNAFIGLGSLKSLKLQHNRISVIPGYLFSNFAGLSDLEIGSNSIANVPEAIFAHGKKLKFLDMSNNLISKLPKSFSTELTQVKTLYLNSNKLGQQLSEDKYGFLLKGLTSLEIIDLSYNKIEGHLSEELFKKNIHLKKIYLSGNRITAWGNDTFKSVNLTLQQLDVSNNYISTINSGSLKYINRKKKFNISMNPFACNCELRWFRNWLSNSKAEILNKEDMICNSPPDWQGKSVFYFSSDKIDCKDYTIYYILGGVSGGVLFTFLIVSLAYTKRWYIRLRMFKLCKSVKKLGISQDYAEIPGDNIYFDGYISYCKKDSEWVERNLMRIFDDGECKGNKNNGKFKLCFRDRDFKLGKYVVENIENSLNVSKKVLVVLTPHYIKDKGREFELHQGILKHSIKNVMPIIISEELKPSQIPNSLKQIFETNQFIEWDKNNDAGNLLKYKLEKFLSDQ
ncbi:uncharacterized protein LOC115212225 [Argonauta hians]